MQYIAGLDSKIKAMYKSAWEIDQNVLIQQACDRQPFIDQGQSLNLYLENPSLKQFTRLMSNAWKGGLPTGKYYLHSKAASSPQMFTIDPKLQKKLTYIKQEISKKTEDVCSSCSG